MTRQYHGESKLGNLLAQTSHRRLFQAAASASHANFCSASTLTLCACVLSHVWIFATLWTVAHQAPLSMGFSRQEYWRVAISYSRGSSWPRDRTCIGRRILYHCAAWEALLWIQKSVFFFFNLSNGFVFLTKNIQLNRQVKWTLRFLAIESLISSSKFPNKADSFKILKVWKKC